MKQKLFSLTMLVFMLNMFSREASSQKVMKLNDSLKNNCELMEVKAGGFKVLHKYEFGSYKLVSGKQGLTRTKTNSKLFSKLSDSESMRKSSLVFVGNDIDTVLINTFNSSKSQTKNTNSLVFNREGAHVEEESEMLQRLDSFVAIISLPYDTSDWKLISITHYDKASGNFKATSILTNGETEIELREVNESDNGKQSMLWACHGFEFFLDKKPIAAVQTLIKQFVWFSKDLDQNMKLVLAASAVTLLNRDMN